MYRTDKITFTILHTNDMHSAFIGMGPSSDYKPMTVNDDLTRGGFARLSGLIAQRSAVNAERGPVLVLDAGDYSMGSAYGGATRTIGGELKLMSLMGYDATTFGNHDFDLGPDGLAQSITVASSAGPIPAIVSTNCDFSANDPTLTDLQQLGRNGTIRPSLVIERGGIRFGFVGVLGKEAVIYTDGAGAATFTDAFAAARAMVKHLRETEKVDVVIALSHGGVMKDANGEFTDGDDVRLAKEVPDIDIVIGGHSHTELLAPIIVNQRTPVVQTGREGRNLGELVISLDGERLTVEFYCLHPIDDTIPGDERITAQIEQLKEAVNGALFASRGYRIDQPLAIAPRDLPNAFNDISAGTPLANLITDAFRLATRTDIGITANGMMRAGLTQGKNGVQTVYDIFAVAPLGRGIIDQTAGSALVTGYVTGVELKHLLEFLLVDNPVHPGEMFPRVSGMRFRYDPSRPMFDVVTAIELGDFDTGYRPIDISSTNEPLYGFTCPIMFAMVVVGIPKYTKGALTFVPKSELGVPLTSRVEALSTPRNGTPDLLVPTGTVDKRSIVMNTGTRAAHEVKEWQAIMDHLRGLPVQNEGDVPTIPLDERALEVRAIEAGA